MKLQNALLFVLISLLCSCANGTGENESVRSVKCEVVERTTAEPIVVEFPGKVYAASNVNLSFRVAGVIDQIATQEGRYVREGDVVAVMDSRDYQLQLEATEAEYAAIKGEADRVIALYDQQSVTQNDYDKAVGGLKRITAKLASHKNAYEDTQLKAPFDGHIEKIYFDRGEAVSAGMPVLSLVSTSSPEVVINIPAQEYIRRSSLLSASAVLELYPDREFALERIGVTPKANLNQLYATRFQVASSEGVTPTPGMSVMVRLSYRNEAQEKLSVPFSALFEQNGASCVWQLEEGRVSAVTVEVDELTRDGRAIIKGGLLGDETIVSAGVGSLKEGQQVSAIEEPAVSNVGGVL